MKINELMRLQDISRWSMINVTRQQSVAEHSFNVSVLAQAILDRANKMSEESTFNSQYIGIIAMLHDAVESVTGDIPTPAKQRMKQLGFDFNEAFKDPDGETPPHGYEVVIKVCDLFESVMYLRNFGTGERAYVVLQGLEHNLEEKMADLAKYHTKLHAAAEQVFEEAEDYE